MQILGLNLTPLEQSALARALELAFPLYQPVTFGSRTAVGLGVVEPIRLTGVDRLAPAATYTAYLRDHAEALRAEVTDSRRFLRA